MPKNLGLLGCGALGSIIARGVIEKESKGLKLSGIYEQNEDVLFQIFGEEGKQYFEDDFNALLERADIIVEALPPAVAAEFILPVLEKGKTLVLLSVSCLLNYPEIDKARYSLPGRLVIPSGSVAALDGVKAMNIAGIETSVIRTTKPPKSLEEAPFVKTHDINVHGLSKPKLIFEGNVREGAKHFPANVNVAAALSFAGIGPEKTRMEVWADPRIIYNRHTIEVIGKTGHLTMEIENYPDPSKPRSSQLAAYSILAMLGEECDR